MQLRRGLITLAKEWKRAGTERDTTRTPVQFACRPGRIVKMLKFTTQEMSGVLVVAFEATDDIASDWQSTHRDWLYKLIESHQDPRFAIDLSDVNYLASSEIGFLVTIKRRIDRRQGRVVMFGLCPYIIEIFETMNLLKLLDVAPTFPAALAKLDAPAK